MNKLLSPIAFHVYRQQRRGALIWGSVFGMFAWVSAYGYEAAYPSPADRVDIARTLGTNVGIKAIFGPAHDLTTPAGFTAWRCATSFAIIGGVWALLLATKILRGEEEMGLAELLYAGPVTRSGGLGQLLVGLAVTLSVLFATVVSWVVPVGLYYHYFSWTAALWFCVAAVAPATLFLAVGAFTSQLVSTRRAASGLAGLLLAGTFIVRAVGESVDGARWVLRLSPLNWVDRLRPFTGTAALPLVPLVLVTLAFGAGAVALAGARDLGGSTLPSRDVARPRTGLLGSPVGLAVRLTRSTTLAWGAGLALFCLVFGIVSSAVTEGLADNKSVNDIFNRLGADLSARGYIGVIFVMLAAVTGFVAANAVNAARTEEAEGRLEQIAAAPVLRSRWLFGRVLVAIASITVVSVLAGLGSWVGQRASGGHIPIGDMLEAGANLIAPGVLVLGLGTLAHGLVPRFASTFSYAVVVWAFLVELVGSIVKFPSLVLDTSLIHHVAAAPAADPRWGVALVMAAVGLVAATIGAVALQRRDLALA